MKSTKYSLADKKSIVKKSKSGEGEDTKDEKEKHDTPQKESEGDSTQISEQDENRVSDYKNEDDQMEVVKQILEEDDKHLDVFKKALDPLESAEFTFDFAQKIGEIKNKNEDEPLHTFTQNVRFYQDIETNQFLPRLAEFSIAIKGRYGDEIVKEEGKPFQEVFSSNHLNLTQFLRKRELRSKVPLGDDHFDLEKDEQSGDEGTTKPADVKEPVVETKAEAPAKVEPPKEVIVEKTAIVPM